MVKLESWRQTAAHIPIDELLWTLYMETNYYNYLELCQVENSVKLT